MPLLALMAAVLLLSALSIPSLANPAVQEQVLENLQYRVNALVWPGAARAGIVLKSLGRGRYRAELEVEPLGLLKTISGQRRDNFYTEMVFRNGRLTPLVYREETRRRGKYGLKEYRFDYEKGRLELWQHHKGKGLLRKWETALTKDPIYDPLSAFYNLRLGALGKPQEGETIRVKGIPYPQPEEIVIRIGQTEKERQKVMVGLINRIFENGQGEIFIHLDRKWVPLHAWSRVIYFGKVAGEILPESKPLTSPLPEMVSSLK